MKLAVVIAALAVAAAVQAADLKSVTVDLSANSIGAGVPFDEPFNITGTVSAQVQRLIFFYEPAPRLCEAKKAKQPPPDMQVIKTLSEICKMPVSAPADAQVWDRKAADKHAFEFMIGALDPNSCYKLTFIQQIKPADETERKELQAQLAKQLREQIKNDPGFITLDDNKKRAEKLTTTAQNFIREKFRACGPEVTEAEVSAGETEVFDQVNKLRNFNRGIETLRRSSLAELCVDGCIGNDSTAWTASDVRDFRDALGELIRDPSDLSEGSKKLWESPVNPALEEHKSTTFAALARLFDVLLVRPSDLRGILEGNLKITGTGLQASAKPDFSSIALLADFLEPLVSDNFVRKNKTPVMTARLRFRGPTVADEVRKLAQRYRDKTAAEAAIEASTFPDILANKLLNQTATLTSSPTLITPGKNPFIHADVGFAYATRIDKAFPYAGMNFYFTPVNKDASLSQFQGWKRISKRTSLLLGVSVAGFEDTRNKNFVATGALLGGVGIRITQYIKVNGGVLAFKRTDPNPLKADKTHNKYVPFFSISIGSDLKTLLGSAGNLFGN